LIGFVSADKHDERKMPKNLEDIESLARPYTDPAIKTLAGIMMDPSAPARARSAAAAILARSRARLRYDHATKSKTWHPK
jgi:hypothetical protein